MAKNKCDTTSKVYIGINLQIMPPNYVSVQITDGLGNRFFQVAAMLGYAAHHGHMPVFIEEWVKPNSHPGPHTIYDYFPDVPRLSESELASLSWTTLKEDAADVFTYKELPRIEGHVKLHGYFQSWKYAPPKGIPCPVLLSTTPMLYTNSIFLHVRRGDYLSPWTAHHCVDLQDYYRRALQCALAHNDSGTTIVVCSDDIAWCMEELPRMYKDIVAAHQWAFLRGVDDTTTLAVMTHCERGAVTANSTFSWWGAYFSRAELKFFPAVWGRPPLPPPTDLYPPDAIIL